MDIKNIPLQFTKKTDTKALYFLQETHQLTDELYESITSILVFILNLEKDYKSSLEQKKGS